MANIEVKIKKMKLVVFLLLVITVQSLNASVIKTYFQDTFTRTTSTPLTSSNVAMKDAAHTNSSIDNIVNQAGYPFETHEVTTEDGYILTIHRIPNKKRSTPVFLQHGLLECSVDWLIAGKNRSLAYILFDNGYDVWLGNARGNTFSKKHQTLSPNAPEYWNFSWEELGRYDHPAVFTYIHEINPKKMFYIGHSMASTTFSVFSIENPDLAKMFRAMIGLAPAVYEYHVKAPVKLLAPFWKTFMSLYDDDQKHEFLSHTKFFNAFANEVCTRSTLQTTLCRQPLFLIAGFNPKQLNPKLMPEIWSHFPAGTSVKLFAHWLQQMTVNEFRKFDYGVERNKLIYNTTEPPKYDLSKNRVPTAVFWSENDWLVQGEDVKHFYEQVPVKLGIYKVQDKRFNHFDYIWGLNAPEVVYKNILRIMDESKNKNSYQGKFWFWQSDDKIEVNELDESHFISIR